MILHLADYTQLTALLERFKGVESVANYDIVTHVCSLRLGIELDEVCFGAGTLKQCMSERNYKELLELCSEDVLEGCSLETLNAVSMGCGFGMLDCMLVDNELEQMYLRGGYLGSTVFYNEVLTCSQEFSDNS